jgi:hypothetical protein
VAAAGGADASADGVGELVFPDEAGAFPVRAGARVPPGINGGRSVD